MKKPKYYLVEETAMPSVFLKVLEAKSLLSQAKVKTVNEAVGLTGLSRSAYYKYRDAIAPFYEMTKEKIITLQAQIKDEPGVLANLLGTLTRMGANVLTINQTIPIHAAASITISFRTGNLRVETENLLEKLRAQSGVIRIEILASE